MTIFLFSHQADANPKEKGKKDQFDHTMWGPHSPPSSFSLLSLSLLTHQSSPVRAITALPLPPSLALLPFSLLGRLLPRRPPPPPLPLAYIGAGLGWKGELPASLNPPKPPHLSPLFPHALPAATDAAV